MTDPGAVRDLMTLAQDAALEAGELVRAGRPRHVRVAGTKSSPTDVVTEMDTASESLLRARLSAARPDDGFHGEEQGLRSGSSGVTWVIDPIDGTVNYLYGLPAYAVSVAAVTGDTSRPGAWSPLAACVHAPALGTTWTAGAGLGAFVDGEPLRTPEPPPLDRALVGTGFGYRAERRARQAFVIADLLPRVRDVRRIGAASVDVCFAAQGRLDVYYERGLQVWDLAAAALVAREAGATVRGLRGRPASPEMVVVGRAPLVDVLTAQLERLDADADDS